MNFTGVRVHWQWQAFANGHAVHVCGKWLARAGTRATGPLCCADCGASHWLLPLARPHLSKSNLDMASKLFTIIIYKVVDRSHMAFSKKFFLDTTPDLDCV